MRRKHRSKLGSDLVPPVLVTQHAEQQSASSQEKGSQRLHGCILWDFCNSDLKKSKVIALFFPSEGEDTFLTSLAPEFIGVFCFFFHPK